MKICFLNGKKQQSRIKYHFDNTNGSEAKPYSKVIAKIMKDVLR